MKAEKIGTLPIFLSSHLWAFSKGCPMKDDVGYSEGLA